MMTATLDDAIGQGLQIIHLFSRLPAWMSSRLA